ncbi:MAG TPA: OsmC family protein [Bryobacteraceae bacterium]|nr:OsmC family protein [Bryobacteraceae bacterium]HPU74484.1 OsmC family protein [Bryobacteraceae bacterium]
MQTKIAYLGGVQFEVDARGHKVICDQPSGNGGQNAGMSPPEFLLASLGTCAAYYALQYLRARSLPAEGLEVHVSAGKASDPPRLGAFRVEIRVPGLEDERHREGVLRAAKSCLIHHTLRHAPEIEITLETAAAAVQ